MRKLNEFNYQLKVGYDRHRVMAPFLMLCRRSEIYCRVCMGSAWIYTGSSCIYTGYVCKLHLLWLPGCRVTPGFPQSLTEARATFLTNLAGAHCLREEFDKAKKFLYQVLCSQNLFSYVCHRKRRVEGNERLEDLKIIYNA